MPEMETVVVRLEGRFSGWEAEIDTDPDVATLMDLQSGELEAALGAMARLLVRWNFETKAGTPAAMTYDGLLTVSVKALTELINQYTRAFRELPNPFDAG